MLTYDDRAALTLVDLLNSSPEGEADALSSPDGLKRFMREHLWSDVLEISPHDALEAQAARARLRNVVTAESDTERVQMLNELLRQVDATPQIVDHDELGWHFHFADLRQSVGQRIAVHCAMAAASLLTRGEFRRLRVCAAEDCERFYLDLSKNRSKLYCESCRGRVHVQAFRKRQQQNGARAAVAAAAAN